MCSGSLAITYVPIKNIKARNNHADNFIQEEVVSLFRQGMNCPEPWKAPQKFTNCE
jgi:hypothetical protein